MDVVIAGAGPAGLLLALRLARDGAHVIVIEPRDHPRERLGKASDKTYEIVLGDRGTAQLYRAGVLAHKVLPEYLGSVIHSTRGVRVRRTVKQLPHTVYGTRDQISLAILSEIEKRSPEDPGGSVKFHWGFSIGQLPGDIDLAGRTVTARPVPWAKSRTQEKKEKKKGTTDDSIRLKYDLLVGYEHTGKWETRILAVPITVISKRLYLRG